MSKETYKLGWAPSVDARATQQNVLASLAGAPAVALNPTVLDNTVAELQFDFDSNTVVEWYIQTLNADGSLTATSVHATFTAVDQTPPQPLTPATALTEVFVAHVA